jgi:hypothetical protein
MVSNGGMLVNSELGKIWKKFLRPILRYYTGAASAAENLFRPF